jgi:lipopolysaccharide biosynthesis glycosyltransferase
MIIIAVLVLLWLYQFATVYHAATTIATTADGHVSLQTPPSRSTASTTVATDTGTTIPIDTQQATKTAKATIGFAVSITGCGSDPITEGAAVLKHSIHRASIHGNSGGQYDYALYAIYHPSAAECALPLQALDFTMLKRETPVAVADIQGDFLRSKIEANGCCGEKELIKLEAYTLTQHEIIVHLDLDVLVLKPMDDLFDVMLANTPDATAAAVAKVQPSLMRPNEPLPVASSATLNAFYTLDYNMVGPKNEHKPVQGGFLVLRPDQAVYEEYKAIVKEGDFRDGSGWGGLVGPFHGSMTFQGIIPYYYNVLHTGQAVEVNRCIYNQMCDNPRTGRTLNDVVSGVCRTNEDECEDCRSRSLEDVVTTHFTLCQKPWWCLAHTQDAIQHRLCRKLHHEWYKIRSELEQSWGRSGRGPGSFDKDQFYGYCKASGKNGYFPIAKPYGGPVDEAQ